MFLVKTSLSIHFVHLMFTFECCMYERMALHFQVLFLYVSGKQLPSRPHAGCKKTTVSVFVSSGVCCSQLLSIFYFWGINMYRVGFQSESVLVMCHEELMIPPDSTSIDFHCPTTLS